MNYEIRFTPVFDKELKRLAKKYPSIRSDYVALLETLAEDALIGSSIGKGCYKVRMAIRSKGKGKSGGARVITYVRVINKVVVLLTVYDKSERGSINQRELDHLIALARELE